MNYLQIKADSSVHSVHGASTLFHRIESNPRNFFRFAQGNTIGVIHRKQGGRRME